MVGPYTCTSLVPLGCVCFGFKSLLEILFCKCGCLFAYGKWIFRKRILVDRKIKAFDPKNIFCQNFTFKSFPKTRKERKRERKDSRANRERKREREREREIANPKNPRSLHREPMNRKSHHELANPLPISFSFSFEIFVIKFVCDFDFLLSLFDL